MNTRPIGTIPRPRAAAGPLLVRAALLFAAAALPLAVGAGCRSAGPDPEAEAQARRWQFQEQMILATRAVNAADLDQARRHVRQARARTSDVREASKVQSLEKLIAGAEAMRDGDATLARAQWSQIQDPALNREVRRKARLIGVEVPERPERSGRQARSARSGSGLGSESGADRFDRDDTSAGYEGADRS